MKAQDQNIPALVIGSGITALGTIRSLGKWGIPTYFVNTRHDFATYSRWSKTLNNSLTNLSDTTELSDFLVHSGFEKAVLFPCTDVLVRSIADLPVELSERFMSSCASKKSLKYVIDKNKFAQILQANNLPCPRTTPIEKSESLSHIEDRIFSDSFLKPINSQEFFTQFGVKAFRVKSKEDAIQYIKLVHAQNLEVELQEYIPGPSSNHYFIDGYIARSGELITTFARHRIRMYPPHFGNSTYMISVPLTRVSGAVNTLEKLFPLIEFTGIFSAEFKLDVRDNVFKILEINARPWWYVGFATDCGVNVCELAYKDCAGHEIKPIRDYKIGKAFMYPYYDIYASIDLIKKNNLKVSTWVLSLVKSKKPYFLWSDPLPAVILFLKRIRSMIFSRVSKLVGR